MITEKNDIIIVKDSTENSSGDRIASTTSFKSVWSSKLVLLKFFNCWVWGGSSREYSEVPLDKMDRADKLAAARHKKMILKFLGKLKDPPKVKMIHMSLWPTQFFTFYGVEKKKTWQDGSRMHDKRRCVQWTQEREKLINKHKTIREKMNKELNALEKQILGRKDSI